MHDSDFVVTEKEAMPVAAYSNLFSPIKIGKLELSSRTMMPSMVVDYSNADGTISDKMIAYYVERAKNDVSLIMLEATPVRSGGRGFERQTAIYNDSMIPGLTRLVDAIHSAGSKAGAQIYHPGRQCRVCMTGHSLPAPSDIQCPYMNEIVHEMSVEEIKDMVNCFADGAERAKKAGFDVIEIHGAHGYMLNQFLSPESNKREDEYGGSEENRWRFPLEVYDAVRARVGDDYPLIFRVNGDDYIPGGFDIDMSIRFCKKLVEKGINAISVTGATYVSGTTIASSEEPLGLFVDNAAAVKKAIDSKVPIIVANRIRTPDFADNIIADGKADIIALGRTLLCDPEAVRKWKTGKEDQVRVCASCSHCFSELVCDRTVSCMYNPVLGHETEYDLTIKSDIPKRMVVVGGGPAGMEAAYIMAMRGHKVTLFEKRNCLGGNVVPGERPPFKGEFGNVIRFLSRMQEVYGVDVRLNHEAALEDIQEIAPDMVLVATGSVPAIPPIPGVNQDYVFTAEDILLHPEKAGKNVLVIGGGSVGIETADLLAQSGRKVTVVEMLGDILNDALPSVRASMLARAVPAFEAVDTNSRVLEIKEHSVVTDKKTYTALDTVVLAVGYRSVNALADELKKAAIPCHLLGDAVKPAKVYDAVHAAFKAAYNY